MKISFENKIKLCDSPDNENLYDWCIQEIDKEGVQVDEDQVPLKAYDSLYFSINEAVVSDSKSFDYPDSRIRDTQLSDIEKKRKTFFKNKPELIADRSIYCKLEPACLTDEEKNPPFYVMLGTKNPAISNISLRIVESEGGTSHECFAHAGYTADYDTFQEYIPDHIQFSLYLPKKDFEFYYDQFKDFERYQIKLTLYNVWGFYTEWRPPMYGIFPQKISVLTPEHPIDNPNKKLKPYTTGPIGSFSLSCKKIIKVEKKLLNEEVQIVEQEDEKELGFENVDHANIEDLSDKLEKLTEEVKAIRKITESELPTALEKLDDVNVNIEDKLNEFRGQSDNSNILLSLEKIESHINGFKRPIKLAGYLIVFLLIISFFF